MNKTWNKVIAAAIVTAGASAGYFYYKYQKKLADQAAQGEEGADSREVREEIVSPRRHYINLFFFNRKARNAATEEEAACETAPEVSESQEAAAEEPITEEAAVKEPAAEETAAEEPAEEAVFEKELPADSDNVHFSSLS